MGLIKEISKCEERTFTCPHCEGEGLVGSGWYPDKVCYEEPLLDLRELDRQVEEEEKSKNSAKKGE